MPYKTFMEDDKHCVYKLDESGNQTGKSLGCHDTEDEAKSQIAALNASEDKELNTKMYSDYAETAYYPIISFAELEAMEEAQEMAHNIKRMANMFPDMVMSIMNREDVTDKQRALANLATEFIDRVRNIESPNKERWQPLTDKAVNLIGDLTKAQTKTEDGVAYPASDFAYTPDPEKPSTWKLRLAEGSPGNITVKQLGRAVAAFSSGGFSNKVEIPSADHGKVKARIRKEYKALDASPPDSVKESSFFVWKEATDGRYHWLARYSNNIRDDDDPPEIISSQSHKRFVEMVDKGVYPLPELWLWHRPEWKWGHATAVAYDDSGFALAAGVVDDNPAAKELAEWMMDQKMLTSHGMRKPEVKRDPTDPTIIIEHQTREISPLFDFAAANKLTGFEIIKELKEGDEMPIPQEKRDQLKAAGLSDEVLEMLETRNTADQKEAAEAGLETKEEDKGKPAEKPETKETGLTIDLVVKAIGLAVTPLQEKLEAALKEIETLKQTDEAKVKAMAELTPEASLEALLAKEMPSLFGPATQIDGRSSLAKSGPKETPVPPEQQQGDLFFAPWLAQ